MRCEWYPRSATGVNQTRVSPINHPVLGTTMMTLETKTLKTDRLFVLTAFLLPEFRPNVMCLCSTDVGWITCFCWHPDPNVPVPAWCLHVSRVQCHQIPPHDAHKRVLRFPCFHILPWWSLHFTVVSTCKDRNSTRHRMFSTPSTSLQYLFVVFYPHVFRFDSLNTWVRVKFDEPPRLVQFPFHGAGQWGAPQICFCGPVVGHKMAQSPEWLVVFITPFTSSCAILSHPASDGYPNRLSLFFYLFLKGRKPQSDGFCCGNGSTLGSTGLLVTHPRCSVH